MKKIYKIIFLFGSSVLILGLSGVVLLVVVLWNFGRDLPDFNQLANYQPPTVTRIHAGDGSLLTEFSKEKRVFVPIESIPLLVIQAFLSAEDRKFFEHQGIDFLGIGRAILINLKRLGTSQRLVGASTITQQVAKNFLLTNEVSIDRKIKEAILAFRIDRTLSKNRILELYLNQIYLGFGSYGVAAAALNYFDKPLDKLSLLEIAFLAGLPKAPNNYHPLKKPKAAKIRRNYVIGRMIKDGHITRKLGEELKNSPIVIRERTGPVIARGDYFVEEVRRELRQKFGEEDLYGGGLSVRTTLVPSLQIKAELALQEGLIRYDRRHGWRGALRKLDSIENWQKSISEAPIPSWLAESRPTWKKAVVLAFKKNSTIIGLASGKKGVIPLEELKWARAMRVDGQLGIPIQRPDQVISVLDVIYVENLKLNKNGTRKNYDTYGLRQIPEVEGGLVAIDPHTGRVLAMSGGFAFGRSEYNRVTQAKRQPGSAFKPFVYLAAMERGFTPASIILDAPYVIDQGGGERQWKPANYTKKFYGPSPLRLGVEKSRNLMTVRLAQAVGMEVVSTYARRFGISNNVSTFLSMSLGAMETTLIKLTSAYAMLVNGGKKIVPTLIDRVQDRLGKTVFRHEKRECPFCKNIKWDEQAVPRIKDDRTILTDPRSAFQIVSMLEGVIQRGTGRKIRVVGTPLGGKTGTTNNNIDTWFIGFSPDLTVGVFVGFDKPKSLGKTETGSSVAVPIFRDFMKAALIGKPSIPFRVPNGIRLVRVNPLTGKRAKRGDKFVILEAFKAGTEPKTTIQKAFTPGSEQLEIIRKPVSPLGEIHGLY
tara:strand:+ start:3935 stop:6391 length:2457 start_codon:yes stop_codon:yes gene_type:complete